MFGTPVPPAENGNTLIEENPVDPLSLDAAEEVASSINDHSPSPPPVFDPPCEPDTCLPVDAVEELRSHPLPTTDDPRSSKRARVDDVEDENDARGLPRRPWTEDYPGDVGTVSSVGETMFESIQRCKVRSGEHDWAPFDCEEEWELARWLMTSGLSQMAIDDYLDLNITHACSRLSFKNKYAFIKKIDMLPHGTKWECELFEAVGDELDDDNQPRKEVLKLWKRDPVECIRELIGNPVFKDVLHYAPERLYADEAGQNWLYGNMWTGNWWWDLQKQLPAGATIAPVILASDKTSPSRFSRDKSAWPIYLSLGNIEKSTCHKPSQHATVLIGYIPVSKLKCFLKTRQSIEGIRLFHECMRSLLQPLIHASQEGVKMILRGIPSGFGTLTHTLTPGEEYVPLEGKGRGTAQSTQGYTPALHYLHQLHKGVFKDHLVAWAMKSAHDNGDAKELDWRFQAMMKHSDLCYFKDGISLITQWTGTEYKNMEKVFLGVLAGATDPEVTCAVRSVLDFIYYAHFEMHSEDSLAKLEAAWRNFHWYKFHSAEHYPLSIRSLGTADGYSMEGPECLHIDFAKVAYGASNHKANYLTQMTVWLEHQEAIHRFDSYLSWVVKKQMVESQHEETEEEQDAEGENSVESETRSCQNQPVKEDRFAKGYTIAKEPAYPRMTVAAVVQDFHATDFIKCLEDFLRRIDISESRGFNQSHIGRRADVLTIHDKTRVPVYTQMKVRLPAVQQVTADEVIDTIYASPARAAKGVQSELPTHQSTVLVKDPSAPPVAEGDHLLHGLRVGQVCTLFKLPDVLVSEHPTLASVPLAISSLLTLCDGGTEPASDLAKAPRMCPTSCLLGGWHRCTTTATERYILTSEHRNDYPVTRIHLTLLTTISRILQHTVSSRSLKNASPPAHHVHRDSEFLPRANGALPSAGYSTDRTNDSRTRAGSNERRYGVDTNHGAVVRDEQQHGSVTSGALSTESGHNAYTEGKPLGMQPTSQGGQDDFLQGKASSTDKFIEKTRKVAGKATHNAELHEKGELRQSGGKAAVTGEASAPHE
ncbi:hypothetical protein SCP_1002230 [Sparassis crispa]|uniref:Uncharacterized protein n=1 Tax=Sparassis crispa TaxID=139825 RepID=A0A401GXM9_9APHY|nr:hypothetical protein SCP_1002230 [Sparassis crispa]GBE86978.1 hypothetical protein SCP_1002230 [Sparassis crispa]